MARPTTNEEWFALEDKAREEHGKYFCRRCFDQGKVRGGDERYSMGVYAGMLCDSCWDDDGRNHDREFDPMDAGESMEEVW